MVKTKVIEIDVAKLDPTATYLIIFNELVMTKEKMRDIVRELVVKDINAVYTSSVDPQNAIKVYQIPKATL